MTGLVLALLAVPVPRQALFDEAPAAAAVARAQPRGEPVRGVVEYLASLAAFTAVNGAGAALLSNAHVTVAHKSVSLDGSQATLIGAGACFLLSPLAAALASWAVGKTSDDWSPSLGWPVLGAYGSSAVAVGIGLGLAAADVDRDTATAANAALYLAVPLAAVLLQNAMKDPVYAPPAYSP